MALIEKFLKNTEFKSYEDFIDSYSIDVPKILILHLMWLTHMPKQKRTKEPLSGVMTKVKKLFSAFRILNQ